MTFSDFTRTKSGNQILFKNSTPLLNVENVKYYKDNASGSFSKKEFRWSFNNSYWSSWESLNQGNISNIDVSGNKFLYLEIRYVTIGDANVSSFSVFFDGEVLSTTSTPKPSTTTSDSTPTTSTTTTSSVISRFTRKESTDQVIFYNEKPFIGVKDITYYSDDSSGFSKKEFRWSFNKSYWASWEPLTQNNISNLIIGNNKYLFLEIRYIGDGKVNNFSINYIGEIQPTTTTIKDVSISTTTTQKTSVYEPEYTPTTSPINATLLDGKNSDFYLWRLNHKGQQPISTITNLQNILDSLRNDYKSFIKDASNIDGDGIGVYYQKSDQTLYFKQIKGGNGISLEENNGIISLNVDTSVIVKDASIGQLFDLYNDLSINLNDLSIYVDSKFLNLEASIIRIDQDVSYLYNQIGKRDASIDDIYNELLTIDNSIVRIDLDISSLEYHDSILDSSIERIDSDISSLKYHDSILDSSFNFLDSWQVSQDASINDLRNEIINLDTSNYRSSIDASINKLRTDISLIYNDLNSVQNHLYNLDSSVIRIDSSLNQIFLHLNTIDSSIQIINNNINALDSSIIRIDSDISSLYNNIDLLKIDISVLDGSIKALFNYNVVQDSSISILFNNINGLESSIVRIDSTIDAINNQILIINSSINRIDLDISSLEYHDSILDSSIERIDLDINGLESSIVRIDSNIDNLESSINRIDLDISSLEYHDTILDSSIERIDLDISSLEYHDTILDSSIERIDLDISSLEYHDVVLDSSIERIDSKIIEIDSSIIRIDANIDAIEASLALIKDNKVINIGDGSISIYSDKDSSDNILLKTIDQRGPVFISQDSSTILIDSSLVKKYDSSLSDSVYSANIFGGIDASTYLGSLKGDTYTKIFDELLFPTVEPSITYPTCILEIEPSIFYEVDQNVTFNFKTTFYYGEITVGELFQNYSTGTPNRYYFKGNGFTNSFPSTDSSYNESVNISLLPGYNIYRSWVTYNQGPVVYDNKGTSYGFLPDGSTITSTKIIETTYPIYANTNSIGVMTKQSLKSMITGNNIEIEFVPEIGGKNTFDIAEYWIDPSFNNRPLIGIETFMNYNNNWEYQGGSSNLSLKYWDVSTTTHTVQGNIVDYRRYIYNGDDRSSIKIRLKF